MLDKIYELKATYEAEMQKLALKMEVLNDLLALVPVETEEVVEEQEETETVEEANELEAL